MIKFLKRKGTWREVADAARTTVHMDEGTGEPKDSWKKKMLLSEHSPIRQLIFKWKWIDLKYWSSVHFTRHWLGIIHWVRTQRSDRTGVNRDEIPQGALVEHECEANAQAIINISRKRLCSQASPETREAWKEVIERIRIIDPIVSECCVPDCLYRGACYEIHPCGYTNTENFQKALEKYRNINI